VEVRPPPVTGVRGSGTAPPAPLGRRSGPGGGPFSGVLRGERGCCDPSQLLLLLVELLSRRFSRGFVQEKSLVYLSSEFFFPHLGFSLFFALLSSEVVEEVFQDFSFFFLLFLWFFRRRDLRLEISDSVSESFVSEILFGFWFSELVLATPQLQSSQQPVR
jgi:hypothetical protein